MAKLKQFKEKKISKKADQEFFVFCDREYTRIDYSKTALKNKEIKEDPMFVEIDWCTRNSSMDYWYSVNNELFDILENEYSKWK